MPRKSPYLDRMKKKQKRLSSKTREKSKEIKAWRKKYQKLGPVEFSKILPNFPDSPVHPKLGRRPKFIILSPDQIEFLTDLWTGVAKLALVVAGRGAGKTAALAVWNCWRMACFDYYTVTCMGGAQEQSSIIQSYIDFWRDTVPEVRYCIPKSTKGGKRTPRCISKYGSLIRFSPCSTTAARGPHVNEVQIDEACAAEQKSKDGALAVDAAWWQIIGKGEDTILIMLSTAHYVFGKFFDYLSEPKKYGFKVYRWSIARHVSGKKPELTYKDKNTKNWLPAVWWVTQDKIASLRTAKSDEEWLCEALGGVSLASGAVFNFKDLQYAFCSLCPECEPYKWEKCKLIEKFKLGDVSNPTKFIVDRKAGYDYGAKAPNALTIAGRKGEYIFVLFNNELKGVRDEEILEWIDKNCRKWKTYTVNPDPSAAGYLISQKLEDGGYTVNMLEEAGKTERVFNVKKFTERRLIIIPSAYWNLIRSLKKASYDDRGKIRKIDDHSFDSLCYACTDWGVEGGSAPEDFFREILSKGGTLERILSGKADEKTGLTGIDIWGESKRKVSSGKEKKRTQKVLLEKVCFKCGKKYDYDSVRRQCVVCGSRIHRTERNLPT